MNCANCNQPGCAEHKSCMKCGHSKHVGPSPELPQKETPREQKVRKMHGELLSPEEAAQVKKNLGIT